MTVPDLDELLTVAERLRLNQQTIRNWIDAGRLPHLRFGRRVRVYRRDLDALIARSDVLVLSGRRLAGTWTGRCEISASG